MPLSPERQVISRLQDVLTEEAAWDWLYSPSFFLSGETPADAITRGQFPAVMQAAETFCKGVILQS